MSLKTNEKQIDQLVETVLKSSKYKNVCEDVIRNIGKRELSKRKSLKIAIKATKNKLHQIGGAYFLKKPVYDVWLQSLQKAKELGDKDVFRTACKEIMSCHYSTRERLDFLDEFYSRIFSHLPPIHSITDVACGFHPLAIPWMPISDDVKYYACDIYNDLIDFIDKFMLIIKVQGCVEARDVVQHPPEVKTNLAFVLNTIPCLDQIQEDAGLNVLESINSKFLAVSFPVKTLGGREKDMRKHYEASFNKLTEKQGWDFKRLEFKSELVFVVTK